MEPMRHFGGEPTFRIELDYSEAPAAFFIMLHKLGLIHKEDPFFKFLVIKSAQSVCSNNWCKLHHVPMRRKKM